jgi:low affinity Fe/Cu permease
VTFAKIAQIVADACGGAWAFGTAVALIVVWAVTGPVFRYSDGWQLTVNTGTTIITFLMVFLIQNTQNRDSKAVQLKLDELIRVTARAHNSLIGIERRQAGV